MNVLLVNNKNNPGVDPFGFWNCSERKVQDIKYVVSHNNKVLLGVWEVKSNFKIVLLEENGSKWTNGKRSTRFVFKTNKLNGFKEAKVLKALEGVSLKGRQQVFYKNV